MKLETNLSLSGAMRRGHEMFTKQIKGKLYGRDASGSSDDDGGIGACALGHALGGAGMKLGTDADSLGYVHADDTWPVYKQITRCPACVTQGFAGPETPRVGYIIYHLNDFHNWSVDQIADWVSQQEKQMATAKLEEAHVEG